MRKNLVKISHICLMGAAAIAFSAVAAPPYRQSSPNRLSPRAQIKLAAPEKEEKAINVYVAVDPVLTDWKALESVALSVSRLTPRHATVRILPSRLAELAEVAGVEYVQAPAQASCQLDIARGETGIDKVAAGEGLQTPFTGKGVVIGIVDAGFHYTHKCFYDKEGALRIKRVWEQAGTSSEASAPERFGYGVELSTRQLIEGAGGDVVNNSHGTHVAALTGGSDYDALDGKLLGMAPEADLVLVSLDGSGAYDANISDAVAYIFDYADEAGLPCVINLSLGAHSGPHDGTSLFDAVADELTGPGRVIVGSSGNHRADKFHVARSFSESLQTPLRTFLDFRKNVTTSGTAEIWGDFSTGMEVSLVVINTVKNEEVERVAVYPSEEALADVELGRNVTGTVSVAGEVSPLNGKHHVVMTTNLNSVRANYAIAVEVAPKGSGNVDIWADNNTLGLTSKSLEGFEEPGSASTIAEIGGTAKSILSVGAYTTRNEYTLFNETAVRTLDETLGDISSFSSAGPTADGRQKPEVTAPGCFISSAVSSNDGSGTLLVSYAHEGDGRQYMYGYMQGTSMASPIVAGIVATWLQGNPALSPADLKEIVKATSRRDGFTGEEAPSTDWGYGKIDAHAGLVTALNSGIGCISATPSPEAAVALQGTEICFLRGAGSASVELFSLQGQRLWAKDLSAVTPGEKTAIPAEAAAPGFYILRVTADGAAKTFRTAIR